MDKIKNYFIRPWDSDAMQSVNPIPSRVSEHLLMVYFTLVYTFLFMLSGAFSHLVFNDGGYVSALGFILSVWCLSIIKPWRETSRALCLIPAAYCFGATLGPLINLIIEIDQRIITKIIMVGFLFLACYFGAIMQSLDRTVIYQYAEYTAPIIIATWLITSNPYEFEDFLSQLYCIMGLPFEWAFVVQLGVFIGCKLKRWFNMPVHIVWILILCFYYEHSIRNLLYVYAILSWLIVHMNLYNQLVIFRAIHNEKNFYVSTAITFFTEFPVHVVDLLIHFVDVAIMVQTIRKRAEAATPRIRCSRARRT